MLNMLPESYIGKLKVSLYVLWPVDVEYATRRPYGSIGSIFICFKASRC